jgi:hypothetical protein
MSTPQQPGEGPMYGQAGHFGQPGGYVPPPPPKERHPLPWILGGAAVLVIAVVVVLVVVLTGGTDTSSPKAVNDAVVKALNDKDLKALQGMLCRPDVIPREINQGIALGKDLVDVRASAKGDPAENGDTATSTITLRVAAMGQNLQADVELTYRKRDDSWCVDTMNPDLG